MFLYDFNYKNPTAAILTPISTAAISYGAYYFLNTDDNPLQAFVPLASGMFAYFTVEAVLDSYQYLTHMGHTHIIDN